MNDYTKPIKRLLRDYAAEAYERELHRELAKLDQRFAAWREGKIKSSELSARIHQYERGPSRELFQRYIDADQDMPVAYAIVAGILERDKMPPELLEALQRPLAFYEDLKKQNELRMPG